MKPALAGLLLLGLASCPAASSCDTDELKSTSAAGIRRMAEGRLRICINTRRCSEWKSCYPEVQAFCVDAGLEKSCGEGFQGPVACDP